MFSRIRPIDVIVDTGAGTAPPLDMAFGAGVANWGPYGFAVGVGVGVGVGIACMYIFCKYNLLLI
jgi:hypothetical protein